MKNVRWRREVGIASKNEPEKRSPILTILLTVLVLVALLHLIAVTHSAYPTIIANTCDKAIRNANYTQYVSVTRSQEMSAVQFTDTLTAGEPSAMVQVIDRGAEHLLDVYIYGCSMQQGSPALTLLFKQQRLVQGTATMTLAHTLSIGQLDTTLAASGNNFLLPLQENVYHEYTWQDGGLRQTVFPGLYPVVSRSEAEALQDQANHDQDLPWKEPLATAEQMAQDILKWSTKSFHSTLIEANDGNARVRLSEPQLHLEVTVSLSRLVQHDAKGLWFVTGAHTANITLNRTYPYAASASPMSIQGTLAGDNKGPIKAMLFDHTITPITVLNTAEIRIQPNGTYSSMLAYSNLFPGQSGLLLLETLPPSPTSAHKKTKWKATKNRAKQEAGELLLTTTILG